MITSTLNPKAIVKNPPASLESFGRFISGGGRGDSFSGISNAANKIVNFNRSSSGVVPITPNIGGLISSISTNILNSVDNSVRSTTNFLREENQVEINRLRNEIYNRIESIESEIDQVRGEISKTVVNTTNQISQVQPQESISGIQTIIKTVQVQVSDVLENTIKNFSKDYTQKIRSFDDNRPNNILTKFLDLYKNAIGFINFFGDGKNISKIEKNLKSLRGIFQESFEVAAVLRQTITKIVKQLSNLPTASPSSGGINLDVQVPGGKLRQGAGPNIRNVGRFAKFGALAGAGTLGVGAASSAMTGMGRAREYQESMLSVSPQGMPQIQGMPDGFMESLSNIVDRFSSAVDGLVKSAKSTSGSERGTSGGGGGSPSSGGSTGQQMANANVSPEVNMSGLKSNFAPIAQDILESGNIDPSKLKDRAAMGAMLAVGQMETNFSYDKAYSGLGGSGNNMQGFLQLNRAYHKVSGQKQYLDYTIPKFKGDSASFTGGSRFNPLVFAEKLKDAKTGWDVANAIRAAGFTSNDFDPLDTPEEANRLTTSQVEAVKKIVFGNLNLNSASRTNTSAPQVTAAPTKSQAAQATSQAISTPVQRPPATVSLPPTVVDATGAGGGSEAPPSAPPTIPAAPLGGGPEVPFLPTANPDNFLTMYSRMVYNIVDA
jgi:hypothetical protein